MKIPKVIKNLIIILVLLVICINVYSFMVRTREKDGYRYTHLWDKIEKIENSDEKYEGVDSLGLIETVEILFYNKSLWSKLPISGNFIKKFRNPKGIIKKYNDYESISVGYTNYLDKEKVLFIDCVERDNIVSLATGKNITTYYTFEYVINDKNQLDDLILLKEVDIDSMTAETYSVREYGK